jgi:hypothetical protein
MGIQKAGLASTLVLAALAGTARADHVIDQMQPSTNAAAGTLAVGGASEQKLAQTFTAALGGRLSDLFLPVSCASGALVVEIHDVVGGLPGPAVLWRMTFSAASLPAVGGRFRRLDLGGGPVVAAGARRALVLSNPTGTCSLARSVGGDSYPGGAAFFDARPNPPGWLALAPERDLPFMEVVFR